MTKKRPGTLWLFSSDNRDLYIQNCFAVLALPAGAVQRFRYQREWVSLGDGVEVTDAAWSQLEGMDVAIAFVAAQSKAYGRAVYVPLRQGTVVRAIAEGDFLFIDFAVSDYLPGAGSFDKSDRAGRQAAVITATDALRAKLGGRFPKADYGVGVEGQYSAVLDPESLPHIAQDEATATRRFTDTARILDDLLATTTNGGAIKHPVFMRFLGIRRAWPAAADRVSVTNGAYELRAGTEYQTDTLEFSTEPAEGIVKLSLPSMLVAASDTSLPLASPYDMSTFTFVSAPRENDNRGELVAEIQTDDTSSGRVVRARIPVTVRPRRRFTVLNWIVVAGSVITTFIVTMLASRGLLWEPSEDDSEYYVTLISENGRYLAYSTLALWLAITAAAAAGLAAAGAVFRRRFGLDSK